MNHEDQAQEIAPVSPRDQHPPARLDSPPRNLPTLGELCLTCAPLGVGIAVFGPKLWPLSILGLVLTVVLGVRQHRRHPMAVPAFEDIREGDYSKLEQYSFLFPFIPAVVSPVLEPLDSLGPQLPDSVASGVTGGCSAALFALSMWAYTRRLTRIGRKRVRAIVAGGSLEGVTIERLELVDGHHDLVRALLEVAAVDGGYIISRDLARLIGAEPEDIAPGLKELEAGGIVKLNTIGLFRPVDQWRVTLTAVGVRCAQASRHR